MLFIYSLTSHAATQDASTVMALNRNPHFSPVAKKLRTCVQRLCYIHLFTFESISTLETMLMNVKHVLHSD